MLADKGLLRQKLKEIEARGSYDRGPQLLRQSARSRALGKKHRKEIEDTLTLAGEIGVKKIVTMSGLPEAAQGDTVPNWLVYTKSWPAEMPERDRYQWKRRAYPYWHGLVKHAGSVGVEKIALENFSAMLSGTRKRYFRLRDTVGRMVGMNLDPSHLFWKGRLPNRRGARSPV